jgi:hypothetical protein
MLLLLLACQTPTPTTIGHSPNCVHEDKWNGQEFPLVNPVTWYYTRSVYITLDYSIGVPLTHSILSKFYGWTDRGGAVYHDIRAKVLCSISSGYVFSFAVYNNFHLPCWSLSTHMIGGGILDYSIRDFQPFHIIWDLWTDKWVECETALLYMHAE